MVAALPVGQFEAPQVDAGRSCLESDDNGHQAKSRHKHLATLGHYVRLGEETSARITADNDPLARRRAR